MDGVTARTIRKRLWNRRILTLLVVELAVLGVYVGLGGDLYWWDRFIWPVLAISVDVGQALWGCVSIGCTPFMAVGLLLYTYVIAVFLDNLGAVFE